MDRGDHTLIECPAEVTGVWVVNFAIEREGHQSVNINEGQSVEENPDQRPAC